MPSYTVGGTNIVKGTFTSNGTLIIPAGHTILALVVNNTTANAVTGGVRIGTTAAGTDVLVAQVVGANAILNVLDSALLKRFFSTSADTTLYVETVTLWNSASVNLWFITLSLP